MSEYLELKKEINKKIARLNKIYTGQGKFHLTKWVTKKGKLQPPDFEDIETEPIFINKKCLERQYKLNKSRP